MKLQKERQFTASALVIKENKVLLIYHKKLQTWLQPGGHLDPNETPPEAAIRETFEETGLHIELIPQENLWVDLSNAKSFERPYLCLLEEIPAHKEVPAHQHMDMIYLARPINGTEKENHTETDGMRWFSLEEIEKLEIDREIFGEVKSLAIKILKNKIV